MTALRIVFGGLLAAASVLDIKNRHIYTEPLLIFMAVCITARFVLFPPAQAAGFLAAGAVPGAAAFIWSRASGQLGEGDAWCIFAAGACCGMAQTVIMCILALCAVSIAFLPCAVIRGTGRKLKAPFVPFLFAAYLLTLAGGFIC